MPKQPVKVLQTTAAPAAIGPYSQATIADGFLYSAGQIPLSLAGELVTGDIVAQTTQVIANLGGVLREAGLDWTDVVKTTVYLTNLADFPTFNEIYGSLLDGARPARSTVQVAALPRGASVEIDLVAKTR
jgi:2-iminobutanoate/2-iminopropanoate deaminase